MFEFGWLEYGVVKTGIDTEAGAEADDDSSDDSENGFGPFSGQAAWLSGASLLLDEEPSAAKSGGAGKQSAAVSGTGQRTTNQKRQGAQSKTRKEQPPQKQHGVSKEQPQTTPQASSKEKPLIVSPQESVRDPLLSSQTSLQEALSAAPQQSLQAEVSVASQQSLQAEASVPPQQSSQAEASVSPPDSPQPIQDQQQAPSTQTADTSRAKNAADVFSNQYFFRYLHTVHTGARFTAGLKGTGYIGYLQLTSPVPMPYFELSMHNFGIGLYPLAGLQSAYPEKNIPSLFLGAGALTFDSILKTALFTGYSTVKASYGGLKLPRKNVIGIGSSQKTVQYGVELSGDSWTGAFFASPEPQKQRMRYGVLGSWHTEPQQTEVKLAVRAVTAFIPELIQEVQTGASNTKHKTASPVFLTGSRQQGLKQRYHNLSGVQFTIIHPNISFGTTGFLSYAANHTVSGSVQAEVDAQYRIVGLRTGVAYTGNRSINWDGKQQHERLTGFIQPSVKIGLFSASLLYAFIKDQAAYYNIGGANIQMRHKIIRWHASWDYRKNMHNLTTQLLCVGNPAWFTGVQWFQKTGIGAAVQLQDRSINPFMLKKYRVFAQAEFCVSEGVFLGCSGTLSQSVRKLSRSSKRVVLQNPVYGGAAYVRIKQTGIRKLYTGRLEVSVKNVKPYYEVKIGYQIQGK